MSGALYLERLTPSDLQLVARAGATGSVAEHLGELRREPDRIPAALVRPGVFEALFSRNRRDPLLVASPFLIFAVMLGRAARELNEAHFVGDWFTPRQRIPVFDGPRLGEFVGDPLRRLFLTDVLTSYTHVSSGKTWIRTSRGWRTQRFSDLDPVRLCELATAVSYEERPAVYRRLGDATLFLTGVFPEHARRGPFSPVALDRLERSLARSGAAPGEDEVGSGDAGFSVLETVGRRSYRLAWEATDPRDVGFSRVLVDVADRFRDARRILNFVTERYLFPRRDQWFGQPS